MFNFLTCFQVDFPCSKTLISTDKMYILVFGCFLQNSVCYGASEAAKMAGPLTVSPHRPAELPEAGHVFLRFPIPAPDPALLPDLVMLGYVVRNGAQSGE